MALPPIEYQLIEDLTCLYKNEFLSDVNLISSDGRIFRVHKCILAARSEIFRAMFETRDSKENQTGECPITDIDGATLEALLQFMYGVMKSGTDFREYRIDAQKLLIAADKYNIGTAVALCVKVLVNGIDGANVTDMLILADKYNLNELKNAALEYIWKDVKEFLRSGHLETIRQYSAELMERILERFCSTSARAHEICTNCRKRKISSGTK